MCLGNQTVSILTVIKSSTSILLTGRVGLVENRANESKDANYSTDYSEEELGPFVLRPCRNATSFSHLANVFRLTVRLSGD